MNPYIEFWNKVMVIIVLECSLLGALIYNKTQTIVSVIFEKNKEFGLGHLLFLISKNYCLNCLVIDTDKANNRR